MITAVTLLGPGSSMPPIPEFCRTALGVRNAVVPWRFDHARNAAREAAALAGWVLYVDADMRFTGEPGDLDPSVGCYSVPCDAYPGLAFASPLLVHASCPGRWHGRTHEYFTASAVPVPGTLRYTELPKSAEALRAKGERDLPLLEAQIQEEPAEIRWRMYRAQTLAMLGRWGEACEAYATAPAPWQEHCDQVPTISSPWTREQAAWCYYQAARIARDALCEDTRAEAMAWCALEVWPTHAEARAMLGLPVVPDTMRRGFRERRNGEHPASMTDGS